MAVNVCKDCTDRQIEPVNCHSICEKYLTAFAKHQANKESLAEKDVRLYVGNQKYRSKRTREKRR